MTLDQARPDDAEGIARIAFLNGLGDRWGWTAGAHGAVVRHEGRILAFCEIREISEGLVIDALYPEQTREGIHALKLLGEWVESVGQAEAEKRGEPVKVGGIVADDNPRHGRVLENWGYSQTARVLAKEFQPLRIQKVG